MGERAIDFDGIKHHVYQWNLKFPLDKWWRNKHRVPFGSEKHRSSCFLDMLFEYIEDNEFVKAKTTKPVVYLAGHGDWVSERVLVGKEFDKAFEDIDIGNIKDS